MPDLLYLDLKAQQWNTLLNQESVPSTRALILARSLEQLARRDGSPAKYPDYSTFDLRPVSTRRLKPRL